MSAIIGKRFGWCPMYFCRLSEGGPVWVTEQKQAHRFESFDEAADVAGSLGGWQLSTVPAWRPITRRMCGNAKLRAWA
jgi:hypothetical protein